MQKKKKTQIPYRASADDGNKLLIKAIEEVFNRLYEKVNNIQLLHPGAAPGCLLRGGGNASLLYCCASPEKGR